jgi:L-threonylcarbamoyladenylate synthase
MKEENARWLKVDVHRPEPEILDRAAEQIRRGGIVAFPTDTLYGLTCDPRNHGALETLFRLKGRPWSLRIPFIAADVNQAADLVSLDGDLVRQVAGRFWPGPLSLLLPLIRGDRLCPWDWGETLAIRVPALPLARELARRAGLPLPATSSNLSGRPPASSPEKMDPALIAGVDLVLDGGPLEGNLPSTLLDLSSSPPRLLRIGAVSPQILETVPGLAGMFAGGRD